MAKPANWIILTDYISTDNQPQFEPRSGMVRGGLRAGGKDVAIWGPRDAAKPNPETLPHEFIIADDDGVVYYRGVAKSNSSFAPLDMYGYPNDGATMIAYREGSTWHVL